MIGLSSKACVIALSAVVFAALAAAPRRSFGDQSSLLPAPPNPLDQKKQQGAPSLPSTGGCCG